MTALNIQPSSVSAIRIAGGWYSVRGLAPFIFQGDIFDGLSGYRFYGASLHSGSTAGTFCVPADAIESIQSNGASVTTIEAESPPKPGPLTIDLGHVQRVIIAGDTEVMVAYGIEATELVGSFARLGGYRIALDPERMIVRYIRAGDLIAIQGRGQMRGDAELAEERAESEERAAIAFSHEHYCDRETFESAVAAQSGLCTKCRAPLAGVPHTHFYEATKTVLCPACSPLKQRYGIS